MNAYSPEKVTCVPRAIRILAGLRGIQIPPERFWELRPMFPDWSRPPYGSAVSYALDICRHFHLASHLDVYQDIPMAREALRRSEEVFGLLLFLSELHKESGRLRAHCSGVLRIEEDTESGSFAIHHRSEDECQKTQEFVLRQEISTLPRRYFFAVLLKDKVQPDDAANEEKPALVHSLPRPTHG